MSARGFPGFSPCGRQGSGLRASPARRPPRPGFLLACGLPIPYIY
ncbi:hypothetical protein ASZ90_001234 [hydrocarbon metagenome]|uniref:Uncharacterized protein n=1 Tax=hydrocarbon metagenome TaxID=938273 RepID=A0A0W8G6V3_9ZZZZ